MTNLPSLLFILLGFTASLSRGSPLPEASPYFPPEYHPVAQVVVSEDIFSYSRFAYDFGKAIVDAGADLLILNNEMPQVNLTEYQEFFGDRFKVLHLEHEVFWVRDYGPIPFLLGDAVVLGDMTFPSSYKKLDGFPTELAKATGVSSLKLPVEIDGGNILSDGNTCFVGRTEAFYGEKSGQDLEKKLIENGKLMGCQDLVLLQSPPHEHIDMYVKLLPSGKALVGKFEGRTFFAWQKKLEKDLDLVAQQMAKFKDVIRVPVFSESEELMQTYTNSILVNKTAIVPRYTLTSLGEQIQVEAMVKRAYEASGFKVSFVPADDLIHLGGAFHCVTVQLPRVNR